MVLSPGEKLGPYQVLSSIGAGGMGEVYRARDTRIGRTVAVKIIKDGLAERARTEAKAISSLSHPNIAVLYDIGAHNGIPFLVMEFIRGHTLREVLSSGRMNSESLLRLGVQIASALQEAHECGIVHRDLKPANIMLNSKGDAKVLDFGLAMLTHRISETETTQSLWNSPRMAGTVPYMAPEQLRGELVDERADIHALGVILYEAATGRHPYSAATLSLITDAILHRTPESPRAINPSIPGRLAEIILKCLNKEPDKRFPSAAGLLAGLQSVGKQGTTEAPSTLKRESLVANASRTRRKALSAVVVIILAAAALALWLRSRSSPLKEQDVVLIADFENKTGDPIFDGGTLKEALTFKLSESPQFNLFAPEDLRTALRLMGRPVDSSIDEATGHEICVRQNLTALIAGSISLIGRRYLIQLKAVGVEPRRVLAMAESEAGSKEEVVRQLGRAAAELRRKAGEKMASGQRFDVPLEQATTSSLEALKAFSLGVEMRDKGQFLDALSHYKRATDLDPEFALAHAHLGLMYGNADRRSLMREEATKAFLLRKRVSERERLVIEVRYYDSVLGDLEATIAAAKLLAQTFPRYWMARNNLGSFYRTAGLLKDALVEFEAALKLSPRSAGFGHSNLGWTYLFLNRFDEAEEHARLALSSDFDSGGVHLLRYQLGAIRNDFEMMEQEIDWFKGKPVEYLAKRYSGDHAAFSGQFNRARQLYAEAAGLARQRGLKERVAIEEAWSAFVDSQAGVCHDVIGRTSKAVKVSQEISVLRDSANALAQCGWIGRAEALISELVAKHPRSTYVNQFLVPDFRALVHIRRGEFKRATEVLQPLRGLDRTTSGVRSTYLRGTAYLGIGDGKSAAGEFTRILGSRGLDVLSTYYPLAHLGVARAMVVLGDRVAAGKAYQKFAEVWSKADADLPVLNAAKVDFPGL